MAVSISSTHMKMMIAFRWMRTPMTPMMNSAAVSASDSASTGRPPSSQDDRASDRYEEKHARQLEREQIVLEQRRGDRSDGVELLELLLVELSRHHELLWEVGADDGHHFTAKA